MPLRPDDVRLTAAERARCEAVLKQWDVRDPWSASAKVLGDRLLAVTYEACAPAVPLLASPDAAAKFLRAVLERPSASS